MANKGQSFTVNGSNTYVHFNYRVPHILSYSPQYPSYIFPWFNDCLPQHPSDHTPSQWSYKELYFGRFPGLWAGQLLVHLQHWLHTQLCRYNIIYMYEFIMFEMALLLFTLSIGWPLHLAPLRGHYRHDKGGTSKIPKMLYLLDNKSPIFKRYFRHKNAYIGVSSYFVWVLIL